MTVALDLLDETDRKGRALWRLREDFYWSFGRECVVRVPAGYVSNMGTVPEFFYRVVTPTELRQAAIVHDWMVGETIEPYPPMRMTGYYSRWFADACMYEVMVEIGIPPWKRTLVWFGVRLWSIFGAKIA